MTTASALVERVTRGTTAPRRLRRSERWLLATHPGLLRRPGLLVVDLGFGASPVTTLELAARIRRVNPTARVVGLDLDPGRVAAAQPHSRDGVEFGVGGFDLGGLRPDVVRAFNVLRQYDESDVTAAWQRLSTALLPGGIAVDGTCDEVGRLGAWVSLDAEGPRALTLALDLGQRPGAVAARLPKALIHHNVAGQPVHELLDSLDRAWDSAAALGVFGARQRLVVAARVARAAGWPLVDGPSRWRRGEVSVRWAAVRPVPR